MIIIVVAWRYSYILYSGTIRIHVFHALPAFTPTLSLGSTQKSLQFRYLHKLAFNASGMNKVDNNVHLLEYLIKEDYILMLLEIRHSGQI